VQVELAKAVAFYGTGDLEWVDPFVGYGLRHEMGPSKELSEADFGGSVSSATSRGKWWAHTDSTHRAWARHSMPCSAVARSLSTSARTANSGMILNLWSFAGDEDPANVNAMTL
jgi:hypothetical protein